MPPEPPYVYMCPASAYVLSKVALSQLWVFAVPDISQRLDWCKKRIHGLMGNYRDLNVNGSALPPILELKTTRCGLFEYSNGRISQRLS